MRLPQRGQDDRDRDVWRHFPAAAGIHQWQHAARSWVAAQAGTQRPRVEGVYGRGRVADATARAGDRRPTDGACRSSCPTSADTLRLWQSSCAASYRLTEIIWARSAPSRRRISPVPGSGPSGRSRPAGPSPPRGREPRTELAWGYLQDEPGPQLRRRRASLELIAQPARRDTRAAGPAVADDAPAEPRGRPTGPLDRRRRARLSSVARHEAAAQQRAGA